MIVNLPYLEPILMLEYVNLVTTPVKIVVVLPSV